MVLDFQILQVFDSCGGELGPDQFNEFSLPYLKDIAYRTKEKLLELKIEPVPMVSTCINSSNNKIKFIVKIKISVQKSNIDP